MRNIFLASAVAAAMLASVSVAAAGGAVSDRVYADSYGNLVIHSPAGYKRIIVGMGHTADAYNETGSYYEPEVVYLDDKPQAEQETYTYCTRPPHVWTGRAHMYGLTDGEIPQAPLVCR